MQEFRNILKGWFGKVLLTIFILPFAFFGIEGIFQAGGRSDVAASVNGVDISKAEVDKAISNQRDAMVRQLGGNIDASFLTDDMLRPRVIESLIQRELLAQAVKKEGLHAASDVIKSYVRNMPQFNDPATGEFSQQQLESVLARAGYTPLRFYDELSKEIVVEQLQQGIGMSAFVTAPELQSLVQLDRQTRDVSYATLSLATFKDSIQLTDDEIKTYFDANQSQYRTEDSVRIQYIAFKPADFSSDVEVADDELQQEYADYVKSQEGQERRRASHILVEVNDDRPDAEALARIKEAKAKVDAGEDFAAVAKTYSDDTATAANGGDLDFAGHGIYDTAFENALFALKQQNDVSDIVKTEFGYHIIKLTGVEKQPVASLDEKRQELTRKIRDARAAEMLADAVDQINELTYAAGDLSAVAEKYKKPVQESELFTRQGGGGITADPKVIEEAFSDNLLKEGMNSGVIELADGSVAVIRVSKHEPARDRTLDEVRDQVVAALTLQKAQEKAVETAQQIVDKIKAGSTLEAVAEEFKISWVNKPAVSRQTKDVARPVLVKLFEMPAPKEGGKVVDHVAQPTGDQDVLVLTKVSEGQLEMNEEQTRRAMLVSSDRAGQLDFENYLATLKAEADIEQ